MISRQFLLLSLVFLTGFPAIGVGAEAGFCKGFQPVLWYLDIGSLAIRRREQYFDDLVPEFCLYGDGNLIYRDKVSFACGKWKCVKLSEAEIKAILDEVVRSEITSYDPMDITLIQLFGESSCSTTVIGVRLTHLGNAIYVQEISIYGLDVLVNGLPEKGFQGVREAKIFKKMLHLAEFLKKYQHPEARDYRPEAAELSVVEMNLERLGAKSRKKFETHWDSIPRWDIREVELDKTEKRGWHNILELKGKEIDDVLKFPWWPAKI